MRELFWYVPPRLGSPPRLATAEESLVRVSRTFDNLCGALNIPLGETVTQTASDVARAVNTVGVCLELCICGVLLSGLFVLLVSTLVCLSIVWPTGLTGGGHKLSLLLRILILWDLFNPPPPPDPPLPSGGRQE